jgi:hypothetical protein
MAYIQQNDQLQQYGQAPDTNYPQPAQQTSGSSADVGSGSGGVSTAGVGAGGTGGWTNIQSYLEANKGDTGSSQALTKQVGSQFSNEQNALSQGAQDFLNQGQKQVDDHKISNDQADQLIKQTGQNYAYSGDPSTAYKDNVSKVQHAVHDQYSGPTSYSYGFSQPTQEYAQDLNDNGGFDQLMNNVYSNAAGKPISRGQYQLQKQLDVSNPNLNKARQDLLNQYTGLTTTRDKTVGDTTNQLKSLAEQFGANQNSLNDYLSKEQTSYGNAIANSEQAAKQSYNDEFTRGAATTPSLYDYATAEASPWGKSSMYDAANRLYTGHDNGLAGFNWQDAQNLLNNATNFRDGNPDLLFLDHNQGSMTDEDAAGYFRQRENNWRGNTSQALQDFYNSQDQKYANTADEEKRDYNTILDFLNQAGDRKQQGFKVRG